MRICPKCGSGNVKFLKYMGADCIRCNSCGYDECAEFDITPSGRSSQKAKGSFSPYKAGGKSRAVKR